MDTVHASGLWPGKVVTEVTPAGPFWEAEPEHQDYLQRYPYWYAVSSSGRAGSSRTAGSRSSRNSASSRSRLPASRGGGFSQDALADRCGQCHQSRCPLPAASPWMVH